MSVSSIASQPRPAEPHGLVRFRGRPHFVLYSCCLALVLVMASVTSVNLALEEIAVSLRASGSDLTWVADAYTVALAAELLARASGKRGERDRALEPLLDRLWSARRDLPDGKTTAFEPKEKTPTYGSGKSATVETTARAASALGLGRASGGRVDRALGYLLGAKDTFGN